LVLLRKILFLLLTFFSVGVLFSQNQDVSIGAISIVGGEPLCPTDSVNFQVVIANAGPGANDVNGDTFYFQVNGPIARAPAVYTINVAANIAAGGSQTFIFPNHFAAVAGASMSPLDLSDPSAPYTITASITIPADPDISNNVSTSLDIGVYTPVVPSLSSNDGDNVICAGEEITFTITPFSGTATYTFKVNNGIIQSLAGVNTITFSSLGGLGSIANGDKVTFDMIDANGCITNSSTQSITVSVSSNPSAGLSASASDGLFCSGDTINFTATGGVSYTWYINGSLQFGATFPNLTRSLSNNDTVTVRVFNASGCYDEESLSFNEMTLDNNGLIVLQNASDSNICTGEAPTGQILGDGSGGSLVASSTYGSISYQWQSSTNGGSNFFDINGANSANYQPAGISTTTLFRRNVIISSDTTSCTFIGDDIVTINKRNTFDINLSTNDSSDTFCQDQNIIVSANTGAATYTFIVNGTTISANTTTNTLNLRSGATRNLAASPPIIQNGDTVTVQITDNFGCTNQQTIPIIIDDVGLNPGVSTNAPGNIICLGENVVIEATGGTSYTFYINNTGAPALPAEVVGNKFTTNRLSDGDIVISRVYNATGCYIDVNETFTVLSISTTGSITLQNAADANICYNTSMSGGIDGGTAGVGGGAAITAIASATIAYQWQSSVSGGPWGDIAGATSQSYSPTTNFTAQTRFKRIAFAYYDANSNGIFDEAISCSRTDSNIVTVNPKANFDVSLVTGVEDNSYCVGDLITINAPAGADTYQFFKNDVSLGAASPSRTVTATAGNGGTNFNNGDRIRVQVTADGCTFSDEITILVDFFGVVASASISSNAPNDTICSGDSIRITAGPPAPGYTYTFTLNGANANPAQVAANVLTTTGITTNTVVLVTVTNASGCSDTASLTVKVPSISSAGQVSIDFADLVLCAGSLIATDISDTASATVAGSAGTVATYQWQSRVSVAAGWQNIAGATSNIFDVSVTPFTVTEDIEIRRLTFASLNNVHCPTGGSPSNVISINVEDDRNPVVTVNPSNTVCAEDVAGLTFTANITDGVGTDTYQWSKNGTAIVGATNTTYSPGLGDIVDGDVITFQVSTTLPDQCSFTSNSVSMNVTDAATATVSSSANANTICSGDSVVITAGVVAGASYAFRLNGAPANASHVAANVYTVPAGLITSQATVTVVVTNGGGCDATAELTIFVPEFVSAGQVSIDFADLVLCAGSLIATDISDTASATVAGSAGTVATYQWQSRVSVAAGWQNIAGATSNIFDVSVTPFTVTEDIEIRRLTFASLNNVHCPTGGSPSNVISINVEDDRNPVVTVNPSNTVCAEDVAGLTFTANITDGVGTDTYQWSKNGTAIVGATNTTYSPGLGDIVDGDVITFQVSTTLPDQCSFTSNSVSMNVTDAATATVSSSANANTICSGDSVVITAGVVAGASYAFRLNGAPANASHVAANVYTVPAGLITSQATVTVVVTNGGGCDATAELTIFVPEFVSAGQVSIDFADLVLCAGSLIATDISDTASATVAGSAGTVATYQWQSRVSVAAGWQNIAGATSNIFDVSVTPFTVTEDIEIRRLTFASLNNVHCPTGGSPSNVISINVEEDRNPVVTVNPSNTVCAEDVAGLTFTANITDGVGTDTYQWSKNGTAIVGATNTTYSPGLGDIVDGDVITFQVSTTLPDQCSFTSNNVSMNVSDAPAAATVSSSANAKHDMFRRFGCNYCRCCCRSELCF
jgi:2C-methyl-D-erythritol 2,4-cyclodiphosphate synthase